MTSTGLTPEDIAKYGLGGDPGFNAAKNKAVIKATIKRHDEVVKAKKKRFDEGVQERSDMIYSYIRNQAQGGLGSENKSFGEYVGKNNLIQMMGAERVRDLQDRARMLGHKV